MADTRRHEILVVPGMPQQEHARIRNQVTVRADIEIEIAAHPAAGINADVSAHALRRMPGMLHRLPGRLKELSVLRVHDRRFLRRQPEEFRVEIGEPVERIGIGHIIGAGELALRDTSREQLFGGQPAHR